MAINKDYEATRFETETFGIKCFEAIKIIAFNMMIFVMTLLSVSLYAYLGRIVILVGVACITGACILSYFLVPTDRPNMIMSWKKELFIYLGALIGGYYILQMISGIDSSQLGVSMGLDAGTTQTNATQGSLSMILQFAMVMTPIGLVGNEFKRIMTFMGFGLGHVTKRKRMEQLQRTVVTDRKRR